MAKKAKAKEQTSKEEAAPTSTTNDAGDNMDEEVDKKEGKMTTPKDDTDDKEHIEEATKRTEMPKAESKDSEDGAEKSTTTTDEAKISPGGKITEPGSYDVLLGRGKPFQNHSGNQRMLQLVDHHRGEYNTTERASKNAIVERLIHLIKSEGGRFLERVDEGGNDAYWSEVPHATAYKKMSHALRSKHRTGSEFAGEKTKGYSSKAASKGNDAGVMGTSTNSIPPMMMHGYPMGGPPGYMGGVSPAMMMGNMMGMGPGAPGGMMANPMFQFEMQRAFFAQQEQMMHAQQRMWNDPSNNGSIAPAESTGNMKAMKSGGPAGPSTGAAKAPEKTNTVDV